MHTRDALIVRQASLPTEQKTIGPYPQGFGFAPLRTDRVGGAWAAGAGQTGGELVRRRISSTQPQSRAQNGEARDTLESLGSRRSVISEGIITCCQSRGFGVAVQQHRSKFGLACKLTTTLISSRPPSGQYIRRARARTERALACFAQFWWFAVSEPCQQHRSFCKLPANVACNCARARLDRTPSGSHSVDAPISPPLMLRNCCIQPPTPVQIDLATQSTPQNRASQSLMRRGSCT